MPITVVLQLPPQPSASLRRSTATGNKLVRRLLTSLQSVSGNPAAADRTIRKLLSSTPSSAALQTLHNLLFSSSSDPSIAIAMYDRISAEPWYRWNSNLTASAAALLEKTGRTSDSEILISTSIASLSPRNSSLFRCSLIESYAQHGLKARVLETYTSLMADHPVQFVRRKAFEAVVKALCSLGSPVEAEEILKETGVTGLRPSAFEYRALADSYGKLGFFDEMVRVLEWMESEGWELDTICCNVMISCYGDHGMIPEVLDWVRRMRIAGLASSIRTYNAALNSCPTFASMVQELESVPISIDEAVGRLEDGGFVDEALLVRELASKAEILREVCDWGCGSWNLDLHGCHLGAAFVVLFLWLEELRRRFRGEDDVPAEMVVICGSGRHSRIEGESPVRMLVSKVLFRIKGPLKMDKKNHGRFVAKGRVVKEWLCCS